MIISYPPTMRRQLLSKHFLISTMPERALDDLVKFSTVVRFEPHRGGRWIRTLGPPSEGSLPMLAPRRSSTECAPESQVRNGLAAGGRRVRTPAEIARRTRRRERSAFRGGIGRVARRQLNRAPP